MSRTRALILVALLVVFVVAGGALIYATTNRGGAQNVTFNVTVTGGKTMSPSNLTAHQNDTITMNVTSDEEGEVHLHGYDIGFEVKPGQPAAHTFKADKTCTCDIEWESTSAPLGRLTVNP